MLEDISSMSKEAIKMSGEVNSSAALKSIMTEALVTLEVVGL